MESVSTTVRTIPFDGKASSYVMWSKRFLSHVELINSKSREILENGLGIPKSTDDLTDPAEAEKLKIRKANLKAYNLLLMSVDDEVSFGAVDSAVTDDLPTGDARLAWTKLKDIHKPKTISTKIGLKREYNTCKMGDPTRNPDIWFNEMDRIKAKLKNDFKYVIDDDDFLEEILARLPEEYETVVESAEGDMNKGNSVTYEAVKGMIREKHGRICKKKGVEVNHDQEGKDEKALAAATFHSHRNRGPCHLCGRMGHRADACWSNDKNKASRPDWYSDTSGGKTGQSGQSRSNSRIRCYKCGKNGHVKRDCTKGKESANSSKEKDAEEVSFLTFEEPEEDDATAKGNTDAADFYVADSFFDAFGTDIQEMDDVLDRDIDEEREKKATSGEMLTVAEENDWDADVQEYVSDVLMMNPEKPDKIGRDTWICDSGASSHMTNDRKGMTETRASNKGIKIGNGVSIKAELVGKYKGTIRQKDGTSCQVTLSDVLYVPELWVNLFSLTKILTQPDVILSNRKNLIAVQKGDMTMVFDREYNCGTGSLLGVTVTARQKDTTEIVGKQSISTENTENETESTEIVEKVVRGKYSVKQLHDTLTHSSEQVTRATGKYLGFEVTGKLGRCVDCAMAKAKQKNVRKENSESRSTVKGGRFYMDISSVSSKSFGGAKFWALFEDEATKCLWSIFMKKKSELAGKTLKLIKDIRANTGVQVKVIRCDNAGENNKLKDLVDGDSDTHINFEFTSPYTPQQNGVVERRFQTLYGKVRAMLNCARLTKHLRSGLWAQSADTATKMECLLVEKEGEISPYEKFYGKRPAFAKHLRIFGEMGIVSDQKKTIRSKLADRGFSCMFVGYPAHHAGDTYSMLNLSTLRVIKTRNVTWLKKSYGEFKGLKGASDDEIVETYHLAEDPVKKEEPDDEPEETEKTEEETPPVAVKWKAPLVDTPQPALVEETPKATKTPLERAMAKLDTSYNPTLPVTVGDVGDGEKGEKANLCTEATVEEYGPFAFVGIEKDGSDDPTNFASAMKSKEKTEWWNAMKQEFGKMKEKRVWTTIKRSAVPRKKTIVGNRWVYKKRSNGVYRARTVAKGYNQVPGVDFQENYAPVVNDVSVRIALICKLLYNLDDEQFDVETAFLYGDLEEEIYMEFPEGFAEYLKATTGLDLDGMEYCLLLIKAIYGLVQAARQWWKKFKGGLKTIGYHPTRADPCLFVRRVPEEKTGMLFVHVDDGKILAERKVIEATLVRLGKLFALKRLGSDTEFLGCKLTINESERKMWITQPKLIKSLREKFGGHVSGRDVHTPGAPKTTVARPQPGDPLISASSQSMYRTGVGMLLYLVKYSRPEISNAVRELSKVLDGATECHEKALLRCIKYVLETEHHGLVLHPSLKERLLFWLKGLCDSDYAADKDTRISVYGYILYLCGAPIAWKSKSGKSVTLSTTEAEYVGLAQLAKEIIFVMQILQGIGIQIEYPVIIHVDNIGAIYLAKNYTTSQRTKHVDTQYHFVREYIEDGILKVVFVRSEDNDADIFTKNTGGELFGKHTGKFSEKLT